MKNERFQFSIILLIVFMMYMGTSIPYPIFPPLFLNPDDVNIVPSFWSEYSRTVFLGITLAAYPLGQFLGSPIIGGCADRYGHKKILFLSLIGSTIGYLLSAYALHYMLLWTLIASRFLTGALEGNFAILQAMVTKFKHIDKHKSFGRINILSAIGYVMGPLIGGFLSDKTFITWYSYSFPFIVAALISAVSAILTFSYLDDKKPRVRTKSTTIWEEFALIKNFKILFQNKALKYLLIISSVFTLAVDAFYEFGPVYLVERWQMTPAQIGIYDAILSFSLALGGSVVSMRLYYSYSIQRVIMISMGVTAFFLALMMMGATKISVFILFGLVGISIAVGSTLLTIQVSDVSKQSIQGEVMGAQLSLRMLGDGLVCIIGGVMVISSISVPLIVSSLIALAAAILYIVKFRRQVLSNPSR